MKPKGWVRQLTKICIARPLHAAGVTRNQVIAVRIALGVLTALVIAFGPVWFSIAATLFLIGILLERSEGELAQMSAEANPVSNRYALISNSLCNALVFVGLGVGMHAGKYGLAAIAMGLLAAIAVIALPWLIKRLELIDGERSPELDGIAGLDADDVLLLVPFALWIGWAEGLLLSAAFAVTTFTCALYITHYRKFKSE